MARKKSETVEFKKSTAESTTVEWKQSVAEIDEIIETAAAFANTEGGRIFIGISPAGKVLGVQVGKGTIEKLVNQIAQHTDPKLHPKVSIKKIDGKDEYERLVIDKHKDKLYFDEQACKGAKITDISKEKLSDFVKKAKEQRGLSIDARTSVNDIWGTGGNR